MRKSPFRSLAFVATLPIFLGAGCAWQSDLDALQKEVNSQRSYIDKVATESAQGSKQSLDMATAALQNAERAANAAQKAGNAAEAANLTVAQMLAKPETAIYALEFGSNKSRVSYAMGRQLDSILNEWKGKAETIQIVGHADMSGSKAYNLALSQKRADQVKAALVRRGVPSSIVSAIGVGEKAPTVQTKDGRRLRANRVVVLKIVAKKV